MIKFFKRLFKINFRVRSTLFNNKLYYIVERNYIVLPFIYINIAGYLYSLEKDAVDVCNLLHNNYKHNNKTVYRSNDKTNLLK